MTTQLFANNAKTTLAAPVNSSQTSITVSTGTGTLFPSPAIGQAFKLTLVSSSSATVNEICLCTARSGDVLTVIRAQEGTTALPFLVGDIAGNFDTAAVMTDLVQSGQLQTQYYQYAIASGTANALVATLPSTLSALSDGMYMTIKSLVANTGPATLNLTIGSTITGVFPIVKGDSSPLNSGDIPSAGYPIQLNWSSTYSAYVMSNPATGIFVSSVPVGAIVNFPTATAPSGYLVCAGQLVSRVTYASLWTFAQASGNIAATDAAWQVGQFSPGNGSSDFRLPQYGGYFLRSLDQGNGIDTGRAIGTAQGGQNQSHNHGVNDPGHQHGGVGYPEQPGLGEGYAVPGNAYDQTHRDKSGFTYAVGTGISIQNQGGTEARPINVSVLTCIKY